MVDGVWGNVTFVFRGIWARMMGRGGANVPDPPMLFRVRLDGKPCSRVTLSARWSPSLEVSTQEVMAAQGLCLLPWRVGQSAVEVAVDATGATAPELFELARGRAHPDRVIEVQLYASADAAANLALKNAPATSGSTNRASSRTESERPPVERSGVGLSLQHVEAEPIAVAVASTRKLP